jgi:MFS family permease
MVSAAVEIPAMLWTDNVIQKRGARWVMLSALVITGMTRLLVLLFPSIQTIFVERAVGGIAFSFYTVSLVKLICQNTPEYQMRSVLAVFTVTLASFTNIISTPIAGSMYDLLGGRWLFLFAVIGYALGWLAIKLFKPRRGKGDLTSNAAALSDSCTETAP